STSPTETTATRVALVAWGATWEAADTGARPSMLPTTAVEGQGMAGRAGTRPGAGNRGWGAGVASGRGWRGGGKGGGTRGGGAGRRLATRNRRATGTRASAGRLEVRGVNRSAATTANNRVLRRPARAERGTRERARWVATWETARARASRRPGPSGRGW